MMNDNQTAAVRAEGRIQVLVAGAGSGKTRTLVEKVVADQKRGIEPLLQVVVTFTNAAAREFRDRLKKAGAERPGWVGTLHAFALSKIGHLVGRFRMVGDKEFEKTILDALDEAGIKGVSLRKCREYLAGDGSALIGKPRTARAAVVARMNRDEILHPEMILGIFKREFHALGLEDHLHLYVDEFQDTAGPDAGIYRAFVDDLVATLFVVGDVRQAIFGFRGATSAEFLKLWSVADWRGQLVENYRSRPALVRFSNGIAKRLTLPADLEAESVAMRGDSALNEPPIEKRFTTCEQEAEAIADYCSTIVKSPEGPAALEDFAVLTRYNAGVAMIRDVLKGHGFEVNCSLDQAEAVEFLDSDPTVEKLLALRALPPEVVDSFGQSGTAHGWAQWLVNSDAPSKTRDLLQPILERIVDVEAIPFALKEGILARKAHAVTVSTVHAAKGLEWPEVWLAGADAKSFDPEDSEDVRLAYVAATRAEDRLIVSFAESRIGFRREVDLTPSPILFG